MGKRNKSAHERTQHNTPHMAVRCAVRLRPLTTPVRALTAQHNTVLLANHIQNRKANRAIQFDSVHDVDTDQQTFFDHARIPELVDNAVQGYAATVFAFGQTGSGKTYTMSGAPEGSAASSRSQPSESDGLQQRVSRQLYERIGAFTDGTQCTVRATYLEIYNEQVIDLMDSAERQRPLAVRGSSEMGFYVEDLSVVQCRDVHDLLYIVGKGLAARHTRHHLLNQHSSRSHAIFSIYICHC